MSNFKIITPAETTNLITNSSFEIDTTGWIAVGSNTILRTTEQSLFGDYSLRCTYTGGSPNVVMAQYAINLANSNNHVLSCWVRIQPSWNGGDLRLETTYTDDTETYVKTWVDDEDSEARWYHLVTHLNPGSDLSGSVKVVAKGTPINGHIIHVDGWQLEEGELPTTFCSGRQPGCKWLGPEWTSEAFRPATTREGGAIMDVGDDLDMLVENMGGLGFPQMENMSRDRAMIDGSEFMRSRIRGSMIELRSTVTGSTLEDYHDKRRTFLEAVAPDPDDGVQPVIIWYEGAGLTKQKKFRLASGFEINKAGGFAETLSVRLQSTEPYWRQIGNSKQIVDDQDLITHGGIAARIDGVWSNLGLSNAAHTSFTEVNRILWDERAGKVYVGGDFTGWDVSNLTGADYLVMYDIQTSSWERCGSSGEVPGPIRDMTLRPEGGVYVCGNWTNLGGATGDGIAYFDGSSFGALTTSPSGVGNYFKSVVIGKEGSLFACGPTIDIGGVTAADGLARYDFTDDTWNQVGDFSSLAGEYLAIHPNGDLYIVGNFNFPDWENDNANDIARWDGTKWYRLGLGLVSSIITHVFIDDNGDVYPSGGFTTAGHITVASAAKWNGSNWFPLGSGYATGNSKFVTRVGKDIVIGGAMQDAGGLELHASLVSWDGSAFRPFDLEVNIPTIDVDTVASVAGELWIGMDAVDSIFYIGEAWDISVGGTAKTFPEFEFEAVATNPEDIMTIVSIQNETTGAQLFLDYKLLPNEKLKIVLEPGLRAMTSDLFGTRWEMLPTSDVANFWLKPGVVNRISMFALRTQGGTGDLTATIRWSEQYWGID